MYQSSDWSIIKIVATRVQKNQEIKVIISSLEEPPKRIKDSRQPISATSAHELVFLF